MHAHAFFVMSTNISTRVHTFPEVLYVTYVNDKNTTVQD